MNLILLFPDDFIAESRVQLTGRRLTHVKSVHRAKVGDTLTVGVAGGKTGRGLVTCLDDALELDVMLDVDPPPPLPLTLVLALPRPKVLNRVIAGVTSLGVKRIFLINAWRVEKSYWKSPRTRDDNLLAQRLLGLEQARDTVLPTIETRRFFRTFVEDELPAIAAGTLSLVAHPAAPMQAPRAVTQPVTLVIGPEGGFIEQELVSLTAIGFTPVAIGPRILRTETAVAAVIGRLF